MKGTIVKRGNRWRVTVEIGYDPDTGKRRRASATTAPGAPKRDAHALVAELSMKHRDRKPGSGTMTVGDMLDRWFAQVEADLSPTTRNGYDQHIRDYLKPAFGKLPVRKLTADKVNTFYRDIRKTGARGRPLSVATVKRVHATLSSACRYAVKMEWLAGNPCDRTSKGGRPVRHAVDRTSLEDIEKVIAVGGDDLCEMVGLALATGARRGELCGLRWADVDFDGGAVTIRRSVGDIAGKPVVIEDRRKSPIRTVTIDAVTVTMLRARRTRHLELALAFGIALEPSGYVLSEEPGQREPIRPARVSQRWRDAAARAGVTARLHDIRHWHITELLAAKFPTPNLIERAGWTSGAMLRVYGHAVAELDREAADIIGQRRERAK